MKNSLSVVFGFYLLFIYDNYLITQSVALRWTKCQPVQRLCGSNYEILTV